MSSGLKPVGRGCPPPDPFPESPEEDLRRVTQARIVVKGEVDSNRYNQRPVGQTLPLRVT